jgi:hypothetical protein
LKESKPTINEKIIVENSNPEECMLPPDDLLENTRRAKTPMNMA